MEKNVGGYDRIARFVLGPVLVIVGLAAFGGFITIASGLVGTAIAAVAVLVGAVFLVTASTQKCPLNNVIGLNTYRETTETTADESDRAAGGTN
jgi:hypothetical protein